MREAANPAKSSEILKNVGRCSSLAVINSLDEIDIGHEFLEGGELYRIVTFDGSGTVIAESKKRRRISMAKTPILLSKIRQLQLQREQDAVG